LPQFKQLYFDPGIRNGFDFGDLTKAFTRPSHFVCLTKAEERVFRLASGAKCPRNVAWAANEAAQLLLLRLPFHFAQ
jgi:hypothetical protein